MATATTDGVGLKGATVSGKDAEASTTGANGGSDEEHSEAPDRRRSGLSFDSASDDANDLPCSC